MSKIENKTQVTTTIGASKGIIKSFLNTDLHLPLFLHSSPGIGKSAVVKQVAEEMGYKFIDVRLSMMAQSDVIGIPYVDSGTMLFSTPDWWPSDPNGKYILFFDELTNAPISTQHAAYRIILDRELHGNKKLPEGCKIVAAGNSKADKTGAKQVAPALANRFAAHIYIKASLSDFTAYAVNANFHPSIIGFLNFNADALYRFNPGTDSDAFATPRSWEYASHIMNMGVSDDTRFSLLSGCIGQGTAIEYEAFLKYYKDLPDFTKIIDGSLEYTPDTSDIGVTFALTSSLILNIINNLDNKKAVSRLDKVLRKLPDDFIYLAYKSIKNAKGPMALAKLKEICPKTYAKVTKYIGGNN